MDRPTIIEEDLVFAAETYCPASDDNSAARVTDTGRRIISLFPAKELPIAARYR